MPHQPKSSKSKAPVESSEEERSPVATTSSKKLKSITKVALESDSEPEQQTKKSSVSRKSKTAVVAESSDSSSSDEEVKIRTPPSRKETESERASQKKKAAKKAKAEKAPAASGAGKAKAQKSSKKAVKQPVIVESESEDDSDDDEELATPQRIRNAKKEMLTDEEMIEKTKQDLEKRYTACKRFIRWYEKEYLPDEDANLAPWERASKLLTAAGAALVKWRGLSNAQIDPNNSLVKAIPKFKENGEKKFAEAMEMLQTLNEADTAKFWEQQQRNRNAKAWDQLVTIKDWDRQKLRKEIEQEVRKEMEDE